MINAQKKKKETGRMSSKMHNLRLHKRAMIKVIMGRGDSIMRQFIW